jgi:hypothetical protein
MTTSHSIESTKRKIVWGALAMFAVATTACGGATQSMTGTAPSSLSAMSGAPDAGSTLGLLKEGRGNGPDARIGETPTTEPGEDQEGDDSGHGHGHPALQLEGFTSDITGTCPDLTIVINDQTITTDDATDFQRGECTDLRSLTITVGTKAETTLPEEATSFHLHIAARMDAETGKLVATYVRMQGSKIGDGDDEVEDDDVTTK